MSNSSAQAKVQKGLIDLDRMKSFKVGLTIDAPFATCPAESAFACSARISAQEMNNRTDCSTVASWIPGSLEINK